MPDHVLGAEDALFVVAPSVFGSGRSLRYWKRCGDFGGIESCGVSEGQEEVHEVTRSNHGRIGGIGGLPEDLCERGGVAVPDVRQANFGVSLSVPLSSSSAGAVERPLPCADGLV